MRLTLLFMLSIAGTGTFYDALDVCRQTGGTLITLLNKVDNDNTINNLQWYGKHFWIGLYDNLSSWTWSLDEAAFDNGLDFSSWRRLGLLYNTNVPEPDLSAVAKICVLMDRDGFWFDTLCAQKRPAVCYYDQGPANYILVTTPMSWEQAQLFCRHNYTDLASVRNLTENNMISTLLTDPSWIGLFREGWGLWSDLSHRNFTNFQNSNLVLQTSKSNLICATASTSTGKWSNVSCESTSNIFCQVSVENSPDATEGNPDGGTLNQSPAVANVVSPWSKNTFKLRLRSYNDLNGPSFEDGILQQLFVNLDNHGLGELKFRWILSDGLVFHKETMKKTNRDC